MIPLIGATLGGWYLLLRRIERWFRRRFTTAGACLLIGLVVSLGTADHEQTQGLGMFLILLTALVTAIASTPLFRSKLICRRALPRMATAGVPFRIRLTVRNTDVRAAVGIDYLEDLQPAKIGAKDTFALLRAGRHGGPGRTVKAARAEMIRLPTIPPGGEIVITGEITTWQRGMLTSAGGLFLRADPLGLLRAIARRPDVESVLVLPPRYALPDIQKLGQGGMDQPGLAKDQEHQGHEEFATLRDYRRGDPMKLVHWRSVARTGRLVVKECEDEHLPRRGLILDPSCPPDGDRAFAEAVAVAASYACTVADGGSLIDLLVVGSQAISGKAGQSTSPSLPMLEALAKVPADHRMDFPGLIACLNRLGPSTIAGIGAWILVCVVWDKPRQELAARLRTQGAPVTILLVLGPGANPPEPVPGLVVLTAGRVAEDLAALESPR